MSSPIVQPSSFDVSKVSISQPKTLESGGKMAYLNYGDARALVIQTPSLPAPFGLSVFDKAGPPKYSVDLALRGYQDQPKVKALFNALQALDQHMIDLGVKNSKLWFKADMKREVVEAFYTPSVRFGKDKQGNQTSYPPNLKVQMRRNRDGTDFDCTFYDQKSKGDPHAQPLKGIPAEELLVKKVEVTALVQCTGVWFAGGKFGVSWKAVQMRLDSVPAGLRGYGFQEEDDEGAGAGEFAATGGSQRALGQGEFSSRPARAAPALADDEEEEDEEEAPARPAAKQPVAEEDSDEEVAPAPLPKKTVVTKKKVVGAVGTTKK
jgi:hypothetical protein